MKKTPLLLLSLAIAAVGAAQSAELPTIKPPRHDKAKTCNIGGMAGVLTPGGMCVKIGGYISGEVGWQR